MLFLIALVIAASFSLIFAPALRKKPLPFYISAAVLSAAVVILAQYRIENELVQKYILALFSKGAAATAFWCVVMFVGALPQKSALRKRLVPSRGELSVFSALLTLSHIVTYAVVYIKRLLNPDFDPQTDFIVTCAVVILLLCIMLPLTVMSFKKIRGKMKPKTWKNIQRTAYLFFALIYIHVLVLYLPRAAGGDDGYLLTVMVYTAVWALYLVMRLRKYFIERRNINKKATADILSFLGFAIPVAVVFIASGGIPKQEAISAEVPVSSGITAAAETTSLSVENTAAPVQTVTEITGSSVSETETAADIPETLTEDTEIQALQETADIQTEDTTDVQTTAAETAAVQMTATETAAVQMTAAETTAVQTTAAETTTTVIETEAPGIYNDGTFTGKAYGYDGYIYVTVTVENDMITSISSTCEEEDISYWLSCREKVISQIIDTQQPEADAVSGATYSSNAIVKAVAAALETAKR